MSYVDVMNLYAGTNSLPMLDGTAVQGIVADAVARGPLLQDALDADPKQLSAAIDPDPLARGNTRRSSVYNIGNLALRDNPNNASNKVLVRPDGTPLLPSQHAVTLESAVFPYLFPSGTGAFQHLKDSTETMPTYLKYRMQSFFTPFTLFKPYLLIMYRWCGGWVVVCCPRLGSSITLHT